MFRIQLIISRKRAPTSSIRCVLPSSRSLSKTGRPAWFSRIHSRAKTPLWISRRIYFISARAASPTMRGPRV